MIRSSRATTRLVNVGIAALTAFMTFGLTVLAASEAQARTITVNSSSMTIANNSNCTLAEAIQAVNTRVAVDQCLAGNGSSDTIVLPLKGGSIGDFVVPTTLSLQRSVTIKSATTGMPVTISQGGSYTEMFAVSHQFGTTRVRFEDTFLIGNQDLTTGIYGVGSGSADKVTLLRSSVSNFGWAGVFVITMSVEVFDSVIIGNHSPDPGGGIYVEGDFTSVLNVKNSSIQQNDSDTDGGGIYVNAPAAWNITNSTVSLNIAGNKGGGIYNTSSSAQGSLSIIGSTIVFNTSWGDGGGVSSFGTATVEDSIISDNVNSVSQFPDWDGVIDSLNGSLIGDTVGVPISNFGANNVIDVASGVDIDPYVFGSTVQALGHRTHRLSPSSPALDALPTSNQTTDQRHFPRGINIPGVGNGSNKFDMGAYEQDTVIQAESLFVLSQTDASSVDMYTGFLPAGIAKGVRFQANANGDSITFRVPNTVDSAPIMKIRVQTGSNRGRYKVEWRTSNNPTWQQIGGTQDFYTSSSAATELTLTSTGQFVFDTTDIRFTVTGKNGNSSGREMILDWILFSF